MARISSHIWCNLDRAKTSPRSGCRPSTFVVVLIWYEYKVSTSYWNHSTRQCLHSSRETKGVSSESFRWFRPDAESGAKTGLYPSTLSRIALTIRCVFHSSEGHPGSVPPSACWIVEDLWAVLLKYGNLSGGLELQHNRPSTPPYVRRSIYMWPTCLEGTKNCGVLVQRPYLQAVIACRSTWESTAYWLRSIQVLFQRTSASGWRCHHRLALTDFGSTWMTTVRTSAPDQHGRQYCRLWRYRLRLSGLRETYVLMDSLVDHLGPRREKHALQSVWLHSYWDERVSLLTSN